MRVEENAATGNTRYDGWQNVFENNEKWLSYPYTIAERKKREEATEINYI